MGFIVRSVLLLSMGCSVLVMNACSPKKKAMDAPPMAESLSGSNELSPSAATSVEAKEMEAEEKVFFSEITVLIETKADDSCKADVVGRSLTTNSATLVSITEDQKIKSSRPIRRSALNVVVELIGLDRGRFDRTLIDHGSLKEGELSLLFRRRPGLGLEMRYLNETIVLRGDASPVYSFTAQEMRQQCKVMHNVNVFQDRTGLFERE